MGDERFELVQKMVHLLLLFTVLQNIWCAFFKLLIANFNLWHLFVPKKPTANTLNQGFRKFGPANKCAEHREHVQWMEQIHFIRVYCKHSSIVG
jgi:hypothetical protein